MKSLLKPNLEGLIEAGFSPASNLGDGEWLYRRGDDVALYYQPKDKVKAYLTAVHRSIMVRCEGDRR
ncbi:MAG: hypothetical protein QXG00_06415 [Candidatus Woesearchaeota archaeon]